MRRRRRISRPSDAANIDRSVDTPAVTRKFAGTPDPGHGFDDAYYLEQLPPHWQSKRPR